MPELHADFSQRVLLHTAGMDWIPSPAAGVDRRMLDRVGDEVARATSIVRYAPDSHFPAHTHGGGEEFLVLEGVFQDEHGEYPAGSYVRNPPTTRHIPGSAPGCVIFVKLWQFDPDDRTGVRLRPEEIEQRMVTVQPGIRSAQLHRDEREVVTLEAWSSDAMDTREIGGGCELLVLSGELRAGDDTLTGGDWLRQPAGQVLRLTAGSNGCRLWLKQGHLADPIHARGPIPDD